MLTFYPPAPSEAPQSALELPPDDWVLEPKIDGIRVIWESGQAWTRRGTLLTSGKGSIALSRILAGVEETLDGEWVPGDGIFYVFDLPDHQGDHDERSAVLAGMDLFGLSGVAIVPLYRAHFPQTYRSLQTNGIEGVVFKRRGSKYPKQSRPGAATRDWLKRRFVWDNQAERTSA